MKATLFVVLLSFTAIAQGQTIKLESTISGNQEQPQVLYMVPWKEPDSARLKFDALNRPFHNVFEHIERDELKRQLQSHQLTINSAEENVEKTD